MSPSSSGQTKNKVSGCAGAMLGVMAFVLLVVVILTVVPLVRHVGDGRMIDDLGSDLVNALESYGPDEPATGIRREYNNRSDPFDKVSRWRYRGEAVYASSIDSDQISASDARTALIEYAEENGWGPGKVSAHPLGGTVFYKGSWELRIYDIDEEDPNRVGFGIESPDTAGPL